MSLWNGITTVTDNTNLNTNTATGNPLSEDDNKILNECQHFANELLLIIHDLKSQGRTNRLLLKFPRSDLERIMGFNTQSYVLKGDALHYHLVNKLVSFTPDANNEIPTPESQGITLIDHTLNDMKAYLVQGLNMLQQKNAQLIGTSLTYGLWLQLAFDRFEYHKYDGELKKNTSWNKWLRNNIGISDSYARQLRELAKDFWQYPQFRCLSISLSNLWSKRKQIKHMFNTRPDIHALWMQQIPAASMVIPAPVVNMQVDPPSRPSN